MPTCLKHINTSLGLSVQTVYLVVLFILSKDCQMNFILRDYGDWDLVKSLEAHRVHIFSLQRISHTFNNANDFSNCWGPA